ncbi:hypothetical protein LZ554_009435 [Drepanopeziza brunnea f. sp. 'monogermtubi']|nr:hypothetical protein LZ554_009435 [Drepanopeziza brunnea f. sp. 'monogermtubi']
MVSQVEPSHSLARRGPSSVVSRSSRHRRHGHGRSHAGGSSFVPQNEFPIFSHTGDVEILVKGNRYLLHRLILTQCSGFFEASTSQEWSKASSTGNEGGVELARIGEHFSGTEEASGRKRRWCYELDTGTNDEDVSMLVQRENTQASSDFGSAPPPPVRNKPSSSNPSFFRSVANLSLTSPQAPAAPPLSQRDQDLLNDYDNLFRIFYNYPPALDPIDIASAYLQCKSLLTLADLYDALAVVGPRIDHHLLQFQSRLWKQIAKYPSSYLKLGYLAQSKSIFQEALIHVVGAWPTGERHIRHQLDSVLDIIEDKVEELDDLVGKIEGRLYRLTLTTSRGERVTPHNGYLEWLAVSLFRQWLAESTAPPPPPPPRPRASQSRSGHGHARNNSITATAAAAATQHANHTVQQLSPLPASSPLSSPSAGPANPNLGRVFRTVGTSPATYLGHDECKRFLKLTPEYYSRENVKRFEKKLEELKGLAREVCRPLMRCYLLGDGAGANYLTCTKVSERDFPWNE